MSTPNQKVSRWWVVYLLFCVAFFGVTAGGVYFDMTHIGFDPVSGYGIPQQEQFYYWADSNGGLHILHNGEVASLSTNLLTDVQPNTCYVLYLNVDVVGKVVELSSEAVTPDWCGLTGHR